MHDSAGVDQLVYYQKGVGTNACHVQRILGGGTGEGVNDNIGCAYVYLCHNYCPGDEIYLFGFSRGAYTARAVAGLVCEFGLLTKRGLEGFGEVYNEYMKAALDAETVQRLASKHERIPNIPIKFIGVWDTVGSLGVPQLYILAYKARLLNWLFRRTRTFQLHKIELYPNIEHACHGLALDEKRAPFSPTLWALSPDNTKTTLKQVWFPGVHSSAGGGNRDHGLSNVTIAWMAQQIAINTDLHIDLEYLHMMRGRGDNSLGRPWGCGTWEESYKGIFKAAGTIRRHPGKYFPESYATNEYIHRSVFERLKHPDVQYSPPDLNGLKEDEFGDVERKLSWICRETY